MRKPLIAASLLTVLIAAQADAAGVNILPNGSRPTTTPPAEYFTGTVYLDPQFGVTRQSQFTGGHVTFAPGARSAWHTHPAGQTLIVTSGTGWVQEWGKAKQVIKPGDVVQIEPGVKHWHGATATNGMRHIALQEMVNGKNVDWLEKVSDEQYNR